MQAQKYLVFELARILEGGQASKDFNNFIRILLAQEQDIKIWSDGMYVSVEYDYADHEYDCQHLVWIDPNKEYVEKYDTENKVDSESED